MQALVVSGRGYVGVTLPLVGTCQGADSAVLLRADRPVANRWRPATFTAVGLAVTPVAFPLDRSRAYRDIARLVVISHMDMNMTESERLIEEILSNRAIPHTKIPESTIRTPDYEVVIGDTKSYWEIKELTENPSETQIVDDVESGTVETYSIDSNRVSESIKSASGQLRKYGNAGNICVVALFDARDFFTKDLLFEMYIKSSMLGTAEYMQTRDGIFKEVKRNNGLLTNRMRYISAIAVLYKETKELAFYHNPNAVNKIEHEDFFKMFTNHFYAFQTDTGLEWKKV